MTARTQTRIASIVAHLLLFAAVIIGVMILREMKRAHGPITEFTEASP